MEAFFMAIFPYHQETGRALYENERWAVCGLGAAPNSIVPLTLGETLQWARRIPRSARVAQGFTRLSEFARNVKQLRAKRAEWRKKYPDPLRRATLARLDRVLDDRRDLVIAARREAAFWWKPRVNVWWGGGKPRAYESARLARDGRYYPKRDVAVPATWLLARIGGTPNVAIRVRQADPRPRIISTPHWMDRVAAGVLACPDRWLTDAERGEVEARADVIRSLRGERAARKPAPEFRLGDIHVAPVRPGADTYVLTLSGQRVHQWSHWPSRAEIVAAVARSRKQREWRAAQERVLAPAQHAPDTLGWRGWLWDGSVLISPVQRTPWHDTTLCVANWSDSAAVRGEAGIHARRMPRDWRRADPRLTEIGHCHVHGIVERFGRYVLGTKGWRAEWVVIRELMARDTTTALALMRKYPDVRVHIKEQGMSQ